MNTLLSAAVATGVSISPVMIVIAVVAIILIAACVVLGIISKKKK